ncbi:DDE-type integrase/transposase/recombinase [Apilactobacillus apisilvae]|uniref:DDE-type integrase/transposase/recombinase n=1 Tax=Apilactobacillus apisilvae TaxID=2923364 RepID=A0ABY4PG30_9LACO|nr:DDE-type integrase/transposase/recombinase [Apilactobacillus apisilvae]UQS84674.1 DDE-type integrase/transposase/recombinase [Apilactobacillus apisilvae]
MLYLSTIMDSFNSESIAHKISNHPNTKLTLDTLNQLGYLDGVIIHSDQGSTYTSREFFELARKKRRHQKYFQ